MNKLSTSTSPYLLQHAHNPVDWFPWGSEALNKAKEENKPIFLSIGYSACHWCHVMAHESFEDDSTAALMNEHFVNIKVDREERPDLDTIYMQATMSMTGSGGWPMSVFLTPDLKPFYAGTYFPPVARHNMPSFKDVLAGISRTWEEQRDEIFRVGGEVSNHIQKSLSSKIVTETPLTNTSLESAAKTALESYDWANGGWGAAPKFPQPMIIEFLIRRHIKGDRDALEAAVHALNTMARGGMYDVVGGGFSRYSVDNHWRVPHFEKMLYDNAQLISVYLHAWQITKDPFFRQIVVESLDFIGREMTGEEGGFYSSLDADSDGEEGKYYVWTLDEIRNTLVENSELFEAAYGLTSRGNWEGKIVLQRTLDDASLAARFKLDPETVPQKLSECHSKLLTVRSDRIRPGTDDKVLTSWNGMMLATLAEAARIIDDQELQNKYIQMATRNAEFLLASLRPEGKLKHSWRNGNTIPEVFLDDYAALILGLLELYQTDFNDHWFDSARSLADEMIDLFGDPEGGFFDTAKNGEQLLLRPKDIQDNATPSGNSLACEALLRLSEFTGERKYRDLAEDSLRLVIDMAVRYPTAFGRWLSAAELVLGNTKQIAVLFESGSGNPAEILRFIWSQYRFDHVVAASTYPPDDKSPNVLFERPLVQGKSTVYVCEGFVCKNPVTSLDELKKII